MLDAQQGKLMRLPGEEVGIGKLVRPETPVPEDQDSQD
jgi:hypothetical protein